MRQLSEFQKLKDLLKSYFRSEQAPKWLQDLEFMDQVHFAKSYASSFRRRAFKSLRYSEDACSREMTKDEDRLDSLNDKNFEADCKRIGVKPYISGDPRGCVFHIVLPYEKGKVPYNTWGGEECGWGLAIR